MAAPNRRPPLLGRVLLALRRVRRSRPEIESDLRELFERRLRTRGDLFTAVAAMLAGVLAGATGG